jgi:myxalamid-type polyketide synthase MxaE and MxaD
LIRGSVAPIAIIGIGCRFPGARGPRELWQMLRDGVNAVREVPEHRVALGYNIDDVYDPRPGVPGKISSRRAGFLDHPELFDPQAFGLSPRDAAAMEPHQRLACEVVWDALEDAGIPVESLMGERVSVMFGHMAEDFSREQIAVLGEDRFRRNIDVWAAGGISRAVLSGRIAFLLGTRGPSFTVDTACSSSLLTVHLACQSLWDGEVSLAIAGGVNQFLTPEGMIALSRVGMLSPDGCCKAFDDAANGFVRAEGAGAVVLKPLERALADGDPIYAVIRGSGFSSDGRDGGHMMAPGREGQVQAMRDAYARAGISPSEVHYVETHGTGTVIGDPVEVGALADVMGPGRAPDRPLYIASIKGNIGHCEPASGVAGLIKAALCVQHRELPAQLHFRTPSKAIPWDRVPIRVQDRFGPWPYPERALAGVNSFGISGTNAHVVLEEAPARAASSVAGEADLDERPLLIPLSGHTRGALRDQAALLRDELADPNAGATLADLGFTLARRRSQRAQRLAVVARTRGELATELARFAAGEPTPLARAGTASPGRAPGVVFAFSGHGGHWPAMGRRLLEREPVFAAAIDAWDREQLEHVDWTLRERIERAIDGEALERIDVLQPALTGIAIALAAQWESWGIRASAVLGHSGGEIAAAHVAGCLSLADAARIACARGEVIRRLAPPGAMALVALAADALEPELARCDGAVGIAGENSPKLTIVSGDAAAVDALVAELGSRNVFARRVRVEFASHSPHMDPLARELARRLDGIRPREGRIPFHSTVAGEALPGRSLDASYWARNLRERVRFASTAATLIEAGAEQFVEISPHPVLGVALEEIARGAGKRVRVATSLRRDADDRIELLTSLGALYTTGCAVDFAALYPQGRVVATPLYPYQREEHWFGAKRGTHGRHSDHPFVGLVGANATQLDVATEPGTSYWQIDLARDALGLEPRKGAPLELGAAELVAIALAQSARIFPERAVELAEIELASQLRIDSGSTRTLQLAIATGARSARLSLASRSAGTRDSWRMHLRAVAAPLDPAAIGDSRIAAAVAAPSGEVEPADAFYAALEAAGASIARERRVIREVVHAGAASEAGIELAAARPAAWLPDALAAGLALAQRCAARSSAVLSRFEITALANVRFAGADSAPARRARVALSAPIEASNPDAQGAELVLLGESGEAIAWVTGIRLERSRPLRSGKLRRQLAPAAGRRYAAVLADPASLAGAELRERSAGSAAAGEIEVEVAAAGLGFLDALRSMGLEGNAGETGLGSELSGRVTALGEGVDEWKLGDEVFGFARGAVATHVVTSAKLVLARPAWLSVESAAALPLARGVAEYAIAGVARVRPGMRVAVHSGGGAIGRSAIALAAALGAEVVASAGSERKRAALRELGARCAVDARSRAVGEEFARAIGGRGFDVVLDLAGDGALLDAVAPGGRYFAIARSGRDASAPLRAHGLQNFDFHLLDPLGLLTHKPEELVAALRRGLARAEFARVAIDAPAVFPIAQLARALRYLARGRHVGKVVVSFARAAEAPIGARAGDPDEWVAAGPELRAFEGDGPGAEAADLLGLAPDELRAALRERVATALAAVLRLTPADRDAIDWQRPLAELGLDSLMGVELGVRLQEAAPVALDAASLFGLPHLDAVVESLAAAVAAARKEA